MNATTLLPAGLPTSSGAQNQTISAPGTQKSGSNLQDRKLMKECQQFEGILIANLWNEMEKGLALSDPGSDPGSGTLQGFGVQAAAMGIASAGGLGIARMLYRQLAPHLHYGQSSPTKAGGNKSG